MGALVPQNEVGNSRVLDVHVLRLSLKNGSNMDALEQFDQADNGKRNAHRHECQRDDQE